MNHDTRKQLADRNPGNNNVNQYITDFAGTFTDINNAEQWISEHVNDVNSQFPVSIINSHPNNQFSSSRPNLYPSNQFWTSVEPPKDSTSQNIYGFKNLKRQKTDVNKYSAVPNEFVSSISSGLLMDRGYNGYNSASINTSNPQYFGGSSFTENVTTANIFGDGRNLISPLDVKQADAKFVTYPGNASFFINTNAYGHELSEAFDGRTVPPDSGLRSIYRSSMENSYQQGTFNQGQYGSSVREKQMAYNMGLQPNIQYNSEDTRIMSSRYNPQLSTPGTYLRPRVQMPALHQQPNQQAHQLPLQSEGQYGQHGAFKIPQVNTWKPVQSQPCVAEETSDLNGDRKRKHGTLDILRESWGLSDGYGDGTLLDVLCSFYKLPHLEEWSDKSEDVSVVKMSPPVTMVSGPIVADMITEDDTGSNQTKNINVSSHEEKSKGSEGNNNSTAQDEFNELPELHFEESSMITEGDTGSNQTRNTSVSCHEEVSKGSEGNNNTTKYEFNESPEFHFEDKTIDQKEEFSLVGLTVDCGFNRVSDDYESVLAPMQSITPCQHVSSVDSDMVLESENTKTQTTSLNDNNSGFGSEIIKTSSVSSVDWEIVSESENTKAKIASSVDKGSGSGSGNMKIVSVSLADSFSASQIKQHLSSVNPNNKRISENTEASSNQSPCQLCCEHKLLLAPAPMYCSSCDLRIMQNAPYYRSATDEGNRNKEENKNTEENKNSDENRNTVENQKIKYCFCMTCYVNSRSTLKILCGGSITKSNLYKTKNNEEKEDLWVLCNRCQNWQHRVCGLYNREGDEAGEAEYICPKCRLTEIEEGKWVPLTQTIMAAKDLPRTNLSDHIEQRLFTRMKQEREETAKSQGTELENVPEAEGLVVRVVVSDDKELEVKQEFRDIFDGKDYPEKLKYRLKLILLFQRLGGVDVMVFGMYVQEYGSDCDGPNNRCVYISYLDSVKYFQPERKTATGEPLRTFVYHEILIGYLEYCKKRGFSTCYIWSCPVVKGQDYVFYCRPKTQKTPKEEKLRKWYKSMLKKATNEGIVVDHNNLFEQFFVPKREENIEVTAARLTYFDGAYWSGAAETISKNLEKEESSGKLCSKSPNKRKLMGMGEDSSTKDVKVMKQLGDKIVTNKENLMIVRLQYICTCCHEVMLSGSRWFCNQCNKIQLCSRCFDSSKILAPNKMHTCHSGKKTRLSEDVLRDVPNDTKDKDGLLINNFFETRDDFLNKCETSQYQFDTLSHAKYSSIMILYHFTNKLVIQPICNLCNNHVLIDQCWHCDNCRVLYVCGSCYDLKGDTCHTHNLTHPSTMVTPDITKKEEEPQKQKVRTVRSEMPVLLAALTHSFQCKKKNECSYPRCRYIRGLLQHGAICSVRVQNDCQMCKLAWYVVEKHKQDCADSNCGIPGCMERRKQMIITASSSKNKQNPMTSQH